VISPWKQSDQGHLEELFIKFAETVCTLLKSWMESNSLPTQTHPYVQFTDDSWVQGLRTYANYKPFLLSLEKSLWQMSESIQCAKEHWDQGVLPSPQIFDDAGRPIVVTTFEQVQWGLVQELLSPVLHVLGQHGLSQLSREDFLTSYRPWRELWSGASGRWQVIIPLLNFTCDTQQVQTIGTQLQLAPFTSEEKTTIWNSSTFPQPFMGLAINFKAFSQVKFKFIGTRALKQDGREVGQDIPTEFEDTTTALRLVKAGDFGALAFFEKGRMVGGSTTVSASVSPAMLVRQHDAQYHLAEADISVVTTLCTALQRLDQQKNGLAVALRRFNQAYGRDSREDQIIDLTIALESSLLAGYRGNDKSKLLSARGAILLSGTKNPDETKTLLKEMYKTRNNIVHGGKLLSELGKHPLDFPLHCENVVRDILREYVTRLTSGSKPTLQAVNKNLDSQTTP
jgi:Apea-like HEPN